VFQEIKKTWAMHNSQCSLHILLCILLLGVYFGEQSKNLTIYPVKTLLNPGDVQSRTAGEGFDVSIKTKSKSKNE